MIFGNLFLLSKTIKLDLNTFYKKSKANPFFRNFGYDTFNFDFTPYRFGNSFEVIYDELEVYGFDIGLKAVFRSSDYIDFNLINFRITSQ